MKGGKNHGPSAKGQLNTDSLFPLLLAKYCKFFGTGQKEHSHRRSTDDSQGTYTQNCSVMTKVMYIDMVVYDLFIMDSPTLEHYRGTAESKEIH